MSKRWIRGGLAAAVVVAAMFATVGEGETESSSGGGSETTAAPGAPTTAPAPASSQSSPIPIGTEIEVAKGWTVKVNSANLNANEEAKKANEFITPSDGKQFVAVNVTIANKSDQPETPLGNVKLSLLPASGVAIDTAFVVEFPNEIDSMAQMQPGASVTGNLVFEVSPADVETAVLLGQSTFTMDAKKDQKFFAIR